VSDVPVGGGISLAHEYAQPASRVHGAAAQKKIKKKMNMRIIILSPRVMAPLLRSAPSRGSAYSRTYAKDAPKEAVQGGTRVLAGVLALSSASSSPTRRTAHLRT
jgi:hypothetical protein